jgi:hypothetical protein
MASLVKPLKTCSHRDLGWDGAKDSDFNGHVDTTKRETYFAPVGGTGTHGCLFFKFYLKDSLKYVPGGKISENGPRAWRQGNIA